MQPYTWCMSHIIVSASQWTYYCISLSADNKMPTLFAQPIDIRNNYASKCPSRIRVRTRARLSSAWTYSIINYWPPLGIEFHRIPQSPHSNDISMHVFCVTIWLCVACARLCATSRPAANSRHRISPSWATTDSRVRCSHYGTTCSILGATAQHNECTTKTQRHSAVAQPVSPLCVRQWWKFCIHPTVGVFGLRCVKQKLDQTQRT